MKKVAIKTIAFVIILTMMISLTACTGDEDFSHAMDGRFEPLGSYKLNTNNTVMTYYDTETLVMYQFIDGHQSGALTAMYDQDGTPTLYDPHIPTKNRIKFIDSYTLNTNNTVLVYYDTATLTMYQFVDGYKDGGCTPMYNPDGTLVLYEENMETKDRIKLIDTYELNVNSTVFVYYDTVKKTMYQFVDSYKGGAALLVYNSDGALATYEE